MPGEPRSLTVFAIPRAFERHIGVAQRNAIQSWCALKPRPRVILLGDDPGTAETAREFGCVHIPDLDRNEFGTPLLGSIFAKAHAEADGGLMLFVNSDIILAEGLGAAIQACPDSPFLLTGRRTHLIVRDELDFAGGTWREALARRVASKGLLGGPTAMDYFVFPHGLFGDVPNFAIGRGWWDHWLAAEALRRGAQLIDASDAVLAVHQDHGFLATEESIRNLALLGPSTQDVSLDLATHVVKNGAVAVRDKRIGVAARSRGAIAGALRAIARRIAP
jgi:hypothetical protein